MSNFLQPPEPDQNVTYLSPHHQPVQNSASDLRNSAETGKFCSLAQNSACCRKQGSLEITVDKLHVFSLLTDIFVSVCSASLFSVCFN